MFNEEIDSGPATVLVVHVAHKDQRIDVQLLFYRNIFDIGSGLDVVVKLLKNLLVVKCSKNIKLRYFKCTGAFNLVDLLLCRDITSKCECVKCKSLVGVLLNFTGLEAFRQVAVRIGSYLAEHCFTDPKIGCNFIMREVKRGECFQFIPFLVG